MDQHVFDWLSRAIAKRTSRRRVIGGLGTGVLGATVAGGRAALAQDEETCHANCNATVPPGRALGLCHAQCGLAAVEARIASSAARAATTGEAACHAKCNATVPPGLALGICHVKCALGGG